MTKKLTDKVALVTGGSRGIGAAVAITYTSAQPNANTDLRESDVGGVRKMG
jgi:NAD(P)-dependent dehydrogenase (short-subunit alcohol dehydrogenase family)